MENNFQKIANKVSVITIIGNVVLSVLKLVAGLIAHSSAIISDAIHSASVTAIILAMILFMTGLGIGLEALKKRHISSPEKCIIK